MSFRLVVRVGDRTSRFPLEPGEYLIGSSPDSRIRIGHPTVSRNHATLRVGEAEARLVDLDSSNGTRVDGSRILTETT
ncbi:MAG: FHA domain-containing protein, partial [Candidatus Aminicenantes bacterium]